MNAVCEHDDDPLLCPPCVRARGIEEDVLDIGPVFSAQFYGRCPDCRREINPSDECRMVDGSAWCRGCADHAERYG